jgi:hypothetical protein
VTTAAALAVGVMAWSLAASATAQKDAPSPEELWDAYPLDPDEGKGEEPAPPGTTGPREDETAVAPRATPAEAPDPGDDERLPTEVLLGAVLAAFGGGLAAGRIRKRRLAARAAAEAPGTATEAPSAAAVVTPIVREEAVAAAEPSQRRTSLFDLEPAEPELDLADDRPAEPPDVELPEPEPLQAQASGQSFLELEPVEPEVDLAEAEPAAPPDVELPEPEPLQARASGQSFLELEPVEPEVDLDNTEPAEPPDVELPEPAPAPAPARQTRAPARKPKPKPKAKPKPKPRPEPEPEIVAPEPEMVEPETPVVEPEIVAPEPEMVEPETPVVEPEPETFEPEPPIEPEPEIVGTEADEYEVVYEEYDDVEYVEEEQEQQDWVPARRFARAEPWPEETADLWTCEIAWKAGYLKSCFRAMVAAPNSSRRKALGESTPLKWTLMMDADTPTPDLDAAVGQLEEALEEAGWEQIEPGGPWYALRFVWRGKGRPQKIETSGHEALTGTEGTDE